jgi:hypothetical protein
MLKKMTIPKDDTGWSTLLREEGPEAARSAMAVAIEAETFLCAAVDTAGLEWCLSRLRQVKAARGNIKKVIEIVLDLPEAQSANGESPTDEHSREERHKHEEK